METRRKEVGQHIKVARRRAKFSSQGAFAAAIGKHETSVANAERGSDRVGEAVYNAIEDHIGWPIGSIEAYIAGTGEPPWELAAHTEAAEPAEQPPMPSQIPARTEFSAELRARWRRMSIDEIIERGAEIGEISGTQARVRYLRAAMQEKEDQLSTEDIPQ